MENSETLSVTQFFPWPVGWTSTSQSFVRPRSKSHRLRLSGCQTILGDSVHTRIDDQIEIWFEFLEPRRGSIIFGFQGGHEYALVEISAVEGKLFLHSSDIQQSLHSLDLPKDALRGGVNKLSIGKSEGRGQFVKYTKVEILLNDIPLAETELKILPEMGVKIGTIASDVIINEFVHTGKKSIIADRLHLGVLQMPCTSNIESNLKALYDGLSSAAEKGIRLLLCPEMCITGLTPKYWQDATDNAQSMVLKAESDLQDYIRHLPHSPYLVAGLPTWSKDASHAYSTVRLYNPDGRIEKSHNKAHSCDEGIEGSGQICEFEVDGVPIALCVCGDLAYPELWSLPVMFGARVILRPENSGPLDIDIGMAKEIATHPDFRTNVTGSFFATANGSGFSYIVGPEHKARLLAASFDAGSSDLIDDNSNVYLLSALLKIPDAFGYHPLRSFRTSETVARAFYSLYRSLGGRKSL